MRFSSESESFAASDAIPPHLSQADTGQNRHRLIVWWIMLKLGLFAQLAISWPYNTSRTLDFVCKQRGFLWLPGFLVRRTKSKQAHIMDSHYTDSPTAVTHNQTGATPCKTLFNQIQHLELSAHDALECSVSGWNDASRGAQNFIHTLPVWLRDEKTWFQAIAFDF